MYQNQPIDFLLDILYKRFSTYKVVAKNVFEGFEHVLPIKLAVVILYKMLADNTDTIKELEFVYRLEAETVHNKYYSKMDFHVAMLPQINMTPGRMVTSPVYYTYTTTTVPWNLWKN